MATKEQVSTFFHAQLNNDSRAQTLAAGSKWANFPLAFFYSNEVSVDIAVKATMLRILALEHARLPARFWNSLSKGVNKDTVADDAITFISRVSGAAIHQAL